MFPSIGTFSLILSLVLGAILGALAISLLQRVSVWIAAIIAAGLLILTPFVGHGTWLFASENLEQGTMTGVHLQYLLLAFTLVVALLTLVRLLTEKRLKTRAV